MKKTRATDLRGHFSLRATPFTREIDTAAGFDSPVFEEPLTELVRTVEQRMSAVLIAPAGAGKTMLLRSLCAKLPPARYRIHQVHITSLSKRDMYREIATALCIEPAGSYPRLMRNLQDYYRRQSDQEGLRPVLLIDECQDMKPDVLATVRVLTNFDLDSRLILSLVLCGDNGLRRLLDLQDMEPLRQRVAHVATLRLLTVEETHRYIAHRLTIAGARGTIFSQEACDAVFEISRGNLRAINHLCRKAMEAAMRADVAAVGPAFVSAARQNLLI